MAIPRRLTRWRRLTHIARVAFERTFPRIVLRCRLLRRATGQFQTYSYTLPDRYPWLFAFARDQFGRARASQILSFGCSTEEVFALHRYFPDAVIKGIDIDARTIAGCVKRADKESSTLHFEQAAST